MIIPNLGALRVGPAWGVYAPLRKAAPLGARSEDDAMVWPKTHWPETTSELMASVVASDNSDVLTAQVALRSILNGVYAAGGQEYTSNNAHFLEDVNAFQKAYGKTQGAVKILLWKCVVSVAQDRALLPRDYRDILEDEIPHIKPPSVVVRAMDAWWKIKDSIDREKPFEDADVAVFNISYTATPQGLWQKFLLERVATITRDSDTPEPVREAFFIRFPEILAPRLTA